MGQTALFDRAAVQGVLYLGHEERNDRGEAVDVGHVDARVVEGAAYGGTFLLGDRAAEGDGTVAAQFVGGDVDHPVGDVGADADGAQRGGQFGEDGDAGADQQDASAGSRGRAALVREEGVQGGPVLVAPEAEGPDAVVAVELEVRGLLRLPGELPPDEVVALPLDDGGDGTAGQVLALGAAVDDVTAARKRGVRLAQEAADLGGEDRGWDVGGQGETASRSESWKRSGRPSTMKSTKSR